MLQDTLRSLGFDKKETAVYVEVLRRGRVLPSSVARATGINRATVYSVAKKLMRGGFIAGDLAAPTMYLAALSPERLLDVVESKKRALKKEETLVRQVIEQLGDLPTNTKFTLPKIQFIDDHEIKDFLDRRLDIWNESARSTKESWWGFQDHTFVERYPDWIAGWFGRKSSRDLAVKLVSNPTSSEREMQKKVPRERVVRFLKEKSDFTASVWVTGEYIVMLYTKDRPSYLIEIYNPVFAQNIREVFKILWNSAGKE